MATRQSLKDYIFGMLGSPVITVELTDFQIDENINFTIQKFSEFAMYGKLKGTLLIDLPKGVRKIKLDPKISEVITLRIYPSGGGFLGLSIPGGLVITPTEMQAMLFGGTVQGNFSMQNIYSVLANMSILDTYFTIIPNYAFNPFTNMLEFFEDITSEKVLLEVRYKYIPEEEDGIYEQPWVKEYALNLCKRTWGSNIGKYDAPLIGGIKANYERIIQEANTELERLETVLLENYCEPLPLLRG
ncbi:putative neck protein [Campylobacter phage F341]|uniref:Putative neck protein n=6 Tax=Fletchervirus TaxID=1636618 RepID=A0A7T3N4P0_9CAUD|nr:putative neck protein [Campylobacter phage F357]QPX63973.1 putative neck protein [Campylobacter phage F358]QPX64135.1 putative neck protein [Campylobacter phage F360]QPX64299.1 putative neck protein [Campylobacter phage F361]QPX64465.1 putative neck protein [Campylobacter phage F365]QPX65284.1 putative neck protein [Campylobacter phage F372]WJZ70102.1 putative neck protein [Campylobacter phage F341]